MNGTQTAPTTSQRNSAMNANTAQLEAAYQETVNASIMLHNATTEETRNVAAAWVAHAEKVHAAIFAELTA